MKGREVGREGEEEMHSGSRLLAGMKCGVF